MLTQYQYKYLTQVLVNTSIPIPIPNVSIAIPFFAGIEIPVSSSAPRPLGAAYLPILLSEEQSPRGNGDREAIVGGAGLCDNEGERAYTVYDPIFGEEKYLIYFKRLAGAKTGYGTISLKTISETQFAEREGQFAKNYSAICP